MSEEDEVSIQKLEDGDISEIVLAFTNDKCGDNEAVSSIDQFTENAQSSEQHYDIKENIDGNGELYDDEKLISVKENNHENSFCSNENLNLEEISSFSTSAMTREAAVVSHSETDMIPLQENTCISSVAEPCCGTDTAGNNDNMSEASCGCSYDDDRECNHISFVTAQTRENLMIPGLIRVPIVGHETMEARSKFTVFKIHVMVEDDEVGWFIFRRYSDFVHLNDQLKLMFPSFRFILPPKRWFKSNFDVDFLEERKQGLQSFVDNITGHRDICKCKPVRDFFCFDDPPGPHDSLEESRAQCECLEEMVYLLRKELAEKDTEIELLKDEMDLYKNQVQLLSNHLSELNKINTVDKSVTERQCSIDKQCDTNVSLESGDIMLPNTLGSNTELEPGDIMLPDTLESVTEPELGDIMLPDTLESVTEPAPGDIMLPDTLESVTEPEPGEIMLPDTLESVTEPEPGDIMLPDTLDSVTESAE